VNEVKYSLRTRLSLSYIFVALICVFLAGILTNLLLEKHFRDYIIKNQESMSREIVSSVSRQYTEDGKWNTDSIENICISALEKGMIIKVSDSSGKVIWDATVHDNSKCQEIISHMAQNMRNRYPGWEGGYVVDEYPIFSSLNEIGKIEIGYIGPYYFSDSDLDFINTVNRLMMAVAVFSFFLSLFIGAMMAKRLSTPISGIISTARMISKGYYSDRATVKSNTWEIDQLAETVNNLAETLENQESIRKRLTADVAHELRTPLATLQSHMEAMIDGIWEPDTERLKSCHEEIIRINRLVGDLEKLARYESENLVLTRTSFDISELIRNLVRNFETGFMNKDISVSFSGEEETVYADKDKISQVIINLLSNAQKYTREGGRVEITVKGGNEATEIRIKDNGIGIPPEDLPHVFERFYRADKSRNRLTGGAGIGLTITKAIVEAHKGKIMVQSKLNEGTEFIIFLPKMSMSDN